jgi:hypothetical protein
MNESNANLLEATTKVVAFSLCDSLTRRIGPERTLALGGKVADALPDGEWNVTITPRPCPAESLPC